jgi:hypothetical protein
MNITKVFGLFAAVFAIAYTIAFEWHWELFSYHPREGVFGWGRQPSIKGGPVMHWYGSIATGALAAVVVSLAALPFLKNRTLPLWLGWAVPLACIVAWGWLLRGFFFR